MPLPADRLDASIIVPTFERKEVLLRTLEALLVQDYMHPWEVIVVDDGSRDGTGETAGAWMAGRDRFRYFRQANAGPARARNLGASHARGRVLVFLDNDILVEKDFLESHLNALAANPGAWVVGRIVSLPELRKTPFGRFRIALTEDFQGSREPRDIESLTAANVSLPEGDFRDLGGFDERFEIASCEDADLAIRARARGIRLRYEPGIVGTHLDWADDLERFCERQRLYSISDVILFQKHGEASPRASLVRQNAPVGSGGHGGLRPRVKSLLRGKGFRKMMAGVIAAAERVAPDSRALAGLYHLSIGAAISEGVRQGFDQLSRSNQ